MILLYIYIGTILFSVIAAIISTADMVSECKQKFGKESWEILSKYRFPRKHSTLGIVLGFIIPIWNVFLGFTMTYNYRQVADKFIKQHEDALREIRGDINANQ